MPLIIASYNFVGKLAKCFDCQGSKLYQSNTSAIFFLKLYIIESILSTYIAYCGERFEIPICDPISVKTIANILLKCDACTLL